MKRYLVLAALLLALSALSLGLVSAFVSKDEANLDYRTTVLYGDPARAGNAVLSLEIGTGNHLFWDAEYELLTGAWSADFDYSPKGRQERWNSPVGSMNVYFSGNFGIGSTPGFDLDGGDDHFTDTPFAEVIRDAASSVGAGERRSVTVHLSDYFDIQPFSCELNMNNACIYVETAENDGYQVYDVMSGLDGSVYDELCQKISEFFAIPVPENAVARITIEKSGAGLVTDIEFASDGLADCVPAGVEGENGMYFAARFSDAGGNAVVPACGSGVYVIPYAYDEKLGLKLALPGEVRLFAGLPASAAPLYMDFSDDGSELIVLTSEDGGIVCRTFSAETGAELQRLETVPLHGGEYLNGIFRGDGFIVVVTESEVCVIDRDALGRLRRALRAPTGEDSILSGRQMYGRTDYMTFDFDGERLIAAAVARRETEDGHMYPAMSDIIASVFSGGEHVCTVLAESAQKYLPELQYKMQCRPYGDGALRAKLY